MAKFDGRSPAPSVQRTPDIITHQGGVGFSRSPKDDLFLLGVANMVGEDDTFESASQRDTRFVDLIHKVAGDDPEWAARFIGWLRTGANMRSAPIVAAAEYVRSGAPGGRQVVASVLQRPDEPGEMLAYWHSAHGRRLPQPIKRGVADAVTRLYTERNMLRYDGQSKNWRWGDVIDLTHPKASAPWQSALFRHALDRRHGRANEIPEALGILRTDRYLLALPEAVRRAHLPEAIAAGWSWERLGGWLPGGMDAEAWEAVIPNMGLMAIVRNLRNFDEAGLDGEVVERIKARLRNPDEVRRSRQFPLRFLSAWKNVASMRWGDALESALDASLANVPYLPGRTLVLIDTSGSMYAGALGYRRHGGPRTGGETPQRYELAGTFGFAVARRAEHADVVLFDTEDRAVLGVNRTESILRLVDAMRGYGGAGTDTLGALLRNYRGHDRVVFVTDEQTGPAYFSRYRGYYYHDGRGVGSTWDQVNQAVRCPVYTWNLAGYGKGHTPIEGNWVTLGGLTDASFRLIPALESRQRGLWPWDVTEG